MAVQEIMTPEQVAEYLQVTRETVYRYIRQRKLIASKIGRRYRIPRQNVELFLAATSTVPAAGLRRYTREQIEEFLAEDTLNDETRGQAETLLRLIGEALRDQGLTLEELVDSGRRIRGQQVRMPDSLPPQEDT